MIETPKAGRNIITRGLPKTGQVTSYQAGDDGQYEAGWWVGRLNANNRVRFIKKEMMVGESITIDRATGLMWATYKDEAGCNFDASMDWDDAIIYAEGLTFAGFTDWRLPNVKELASIADYSRVNPAIDITMFNCAAAYYWSATTYSAMTDWAFVVDIFTGALIHDTDKSLGEALGVKIRCVRGGL